MLDISYPKDYKKFDKYLWADYYELRCLKNIDGEITEGEADDDEDINEDITDDTDPSEMQEDELEQEVETDAAQRNDKREAFVKSVFRIISYRSVSYSESYPFIYSGKNVLKLKDNLTPKQKLYIYLLMCSHLLYFSKGEIVELTGDFELLSVEVLKKYIADPKLEVHIFGKNPKHTSSKFKGINVSKKIIKLSELLGEQANLNASYPVQSSGDEGADIVAWLPFPDSAGNMLAFFGQCKCSLDWPTLRHSSSYQEWMHKIYLRHPNNSMAFIPYCYRSAEGLWHQPQNTSNSIMFDRQRLLNLISDHTDFFDQTDSFTLLNTFIETKEGIV